MDTSEHARIYEAIRQERDRLYAILDDDPQKAIDEARRLSPKQDLSEANIVGIKASIFIDGGEQLADGELVSEGIPVQPTLHFHGTCHLLVRLKSTHLDDVAITVLSGKRPESQDCSVAISSGEVAP